MLKINVNTLKNSIDELSYLINQYEINTMTIIQEVKNAEFNWHDQHSTSFFEQITSQRKDLQRFIADLTSIKDSYRTIHKSITKIDSNVKTIFVKDESKNSILNLYTLNINNLKDIKKRLNNLDISFCTYNERLSINNEIRNLSSLITRLETSKSRIDKVFADLNNLENSINFILSKLQVSQMTLFDNTQYL